MSRARPPKPALAPARAPVRKVRLETERFLLRTLTPEDANEKWIAWAADIDVVEPLNVPVRKMTMEDVRAHFRTYDQERQLLIGIFTRQGGDFPPNIFIGVYILAFNHQHRTVTFNVMIGDKEYWGQRVVLETRAALLDFVFDVVRIEKAIGAPMCRNFPAVFNYKAQGWTLEGTLRAHARSAHRPGERLDEYSFGMLPDQWRALKAARAAAGKGALS